MPTRALAGFRVLVTRPAESSQKLSDLIAAQGGLPVRYPVLEIVLEDEQPTMQREISNLSAADLAIFVSVHAVRSFVSALGRQQQQLPEHLKIAAIGPTTAKELESRGFRVDYVPRGSVNSEGLIRTLSDLDLSGKKLVIFQGQSGRGVLLKYLGSAGAKVKEIESYRRIPNTDSIDQQLSRWLMDGRRVLTITSVEILRQLLEKVPQAVRNQVLVSDVAVLSERIAEACSRCGFSGRICVASTSGDRGLLDAMLACVGDDHD